MMMGLMWNESTVAALIGMLGCSNFGYSRSYWVGGFDWKASVNLLGDIYRRREYIPDRKDSQGKHKTAS